MENSIVISLGSVQIIKKAKKHILTLGKDTITSLAKGCLGSSSNSALWPTASTCFMVKDRRDTGWLQDVSKLTHPTPPGVPGRVVKHRPSQPQFSQPGGHFLQWQDISALAAASSCPRGRMARSTAVVREANPVPPDRSSSFNHLGGFWGGNFHS